MKSNKYIYLLTALFSISTILQSISVFSKLNVVLISLASILIIISFLKEKYSKKSFIIIFIAFLINIFSFLITKEPVMEVSIYFHYLFWIIFFVYITQFYDSFFSEFIKNKNYTTLILLLWNIIVFVSLFLTSAYTYKWGEGLYFSSFASSEHRFASAAFLIFIISQTYYFVTKEKKYLLLCIIPLLTIYMSGARVYLGLIFMAAVYFYYINCDKKAKFYLTVIPFSLIFIVILLFSPMMDKFIVTNQTGYYGYLATLTSGRSVFWEIDILEFFKCSLFNRIFGNGFNFVYDVNEINTGARIFAHNDYINILLNFGYVGLFLYLKVFIDFAKKHLISQKKILNFILIFIIVFNAFFNSLYVYICAIVAIPFLSISSNQYISKLEGDKNENNKI